MHSEEEARAKLDALMEEMKGLKPDVPWREMMVSRAMMLGICQKDRVELRISSGPGDRDIVALAQRTIDAFFSATLLYPTNLAVHSAVEQYFRNEELIFKAKHQLGADFLAGLYADFDPPPVHIEIDDSLDTHTVAARITMDTEEFNQAREDALERVFAQLRREGGRQ